MMKAITVQSTLKTLRQLMMGVLVQMGHFRLLVLAVIINAERVTEYRR